MNVQCKIYYPHTNSHIFFLFNFANSTIARFQPPFFYIHVINLHRLHCNKYHFRLNNLEFDTEDLNIK